MLHVSRGLGGDQTEIRAVSIYFGILGFLSKVVSSLVPRGALWIEQERAGCARFVAVMLDRRIFTSTY
jgi:hypothetical protein